jgi:hypothetical protein
VAGAATDTGKTAGTTRHAARARELATGAATDTRDAALPARAATGTAVLATGAAGSVGVAAAPARVLLEDDMRGRRTSRCRTRHESFSRRRWRNSNRCSNSATNHYRFHQVEFR